MLFCRVASSSSLLQGSSSSFSVSVPGSTSYPTLSSLSTSTACKPDAIRRRIFELLCVLALFALAAVSFTIGATRALGTSVFWHGQPGMHKPFPFHLGKTVSRYGSFSIFECVCMHKAVNSLSMSARSGSFSPCQPWPPMIYPAHHGLQCCLYKVRIDWECYTFRDHWLACARLGCHPKASLNSG